ncbi:HET-domain-containing protein, partial [Setomelanomma holmii]
MRLLQRHDDGRISLTEDIFDERTIPAYAILSHTWGATDDEVTFADLTNGRGAAKAGYNKILFCARQARRDGLKHFWVDCCCINKADCAELSQAIRSMFRWYRNAARCYVFLSDVDMSAWEDDCEVSTAYWISSFRSSRWFTRGWTLQELLAPTSIEFFSRDGRRLGDGLSLVHTISEITRVPLAALQGGPLSHFSVSERISWMASRQCKLEEDEAYSLQGLFDVHMPLLYGEGKKSAMARL